ncbi:MAG: acyl-CoA dehydrogenase family protein [Candidatus Bathyarchaeota archaeon]|jgi:alkylation response protein AidB-like acyl-CoA dehydrogenase
MLENNFLSTEEEVVVRDEVKRFVKNVDPDLLRKMDQNEIDYPYEFLQEAAKKGLLGLRFPKKFGGRGMTWTTEMIALEEIGVLGCGLGCSYAMISIVGEALNNFGTNMQKQKFLAPLIKGEILSAEGLTEPRGGSDFFGTTTKAVRKGNSWIINGEKRFIAGGKVADFYLIYARTDPKAPGHKALTAFLIERDMGVKVEEIYNLLGFRGMGTARIRFKNIKVTDEFRLGEVNGGAAIFNRMMVPERLTSAAGAIGTARAALEIAVDYSTKRKAFGMPIRNFQGINFKIADCIIKLDAARALVHTATTAVDKSDMGQPIDPRRIVSEAKSFATDIGWEIVNVAMQIMGGIGYTKIYPIERLLRDMRLAPIWTGSNEIMKLLIQHEVYKMMKLPIRDRNVEMDAIEWDKEIEKVYE